MWIVVWFDFLFNGVPTFVSYSMSKSYLEKNSSRII